MSRESKSKVSVTFGIYERGTLVRRRTVTEDIIKVGREPKSHLHLDDLLASRMHAVIEVASPDEMLLIDLGNESGTMVNGVKVSKCKIKPGAEIQIGSTLVVVEHASYALAAMPTFDVPSAYTYALVKSGPAVNPDEVEIGHLSSVEVMILWGTTVLHVEHLTPPRSFYVGEETGGDHPCDYFVPSEKIGTTRAPIVLADDREIHVALLRGASGTVDLPGHSTMTLEEAVLGGHTQACVEHSGARQLALPPGGKARMEMNGLTFVVSAVAAGKPVAHGLFARTDTSSLLYVGLSMAAHASLIGAMAFFVPPLGLTDGEAMGRDQVYLIQQYLQAAADRETEARDNTGATASEDVREGGSGSAAAGEQGVTGTPNTKQTGHRYAVAGRKDNPDPHIAREAAIREAATIGMIGLLGSGGGDPDAPTAPWGRLDSSGNDLASARGNMWGDTPGESFGMNGLGLVGVGEGGGKSGLGIGIGDIGTINHGAGTGDGDGIGNGHDGRV